MTEHRRGGQRGEGLPSWLTTTVVLTVLGLLVYNVVIVGPEGYPVSIMLGGLLGTYSGLNEFLKLRGVNAGGSGKSPAGPNSEGG